MGELIQGLMKELCLSQAELASRLGVPYDTVRGWASGRADPSPENRSALVLFVREHSAKLGRVSGDVRSMGSGTYRYLAEKLQSAVRSMMGPHEDPERAIEAASLECWLALKDLGELPDEHAQLLRERIQRTIEASDRDGKMDTVEKLEFSNAVLGLLLWAEVEFWKN